MKDARPQLPSGKSPRMFFARCVWWALWGGRFPFANSDTVTVEYTAGHYYFKAKPSRGNPSKSTPSGNWNYRGMYDPAAANPYMTFDVVQYGSGTSAGMYLSTIDNNNNAPDSGIGWVQVSTGTGTWL
jgi:hypothetical protein